MLRRVSSRRASLYEEQFTAFTVIYGAMLFHVTSDKRQPLNLVYGTGATVNALSQEFRSNRSGEGR